MGIRELIRKFVSNKPPEVDEAANHMLQMLIEKAQYMNVKFKYKKLDNDGYGRFHIVPFHTSPYYDPNWITKMEILISPHRMSKMQEALTMAHEMGHAFQFLGECSGDLKEWYLFRESNSELFVEQDAWMRAVRILHEVGFKDWEFMCSFAIWAFATHAIHQMGKGEPTRLRCQMFLDELREKISKITKEVVYE